MLHKELPRLAVCRACSRFIKQEEIDCPFCGKNLIQSAIEHARRMQEAQRACTELEQALTAAGFTLPNLPEA